MSEVIGVYTAPTRVRDEATVTTWRPPDAKGVLQLSLAAIWLLDGILQLQGYFFTKAFGSQFIPAVAPGNPTVIARPITWSASVIEHHAVLADSAFALIQVLIGLAIAWRPTRKLALAVSIVWAFGVWWIGEGLGGVMNGAADPVSGAPGAVILYALLAVLLWPKVGADRGGPFIAARVVGESAAKGLWAVLWGALTYFAVAGTNSSPQGLHRLIGSMAMGEPSWLARLDTGAAGLVDHRGLAISIVLAVLLGVIAIGVYLPTRLADATLVLAVLLALAFWVVGENFGALFTRSGTDVNSGPLLVLLAFAYWRPSSATRAGEKGAPS